MNDVILESIKIIKNDDVRENTFEFKDTDIIEEYSIIWSFCRSYHIHSQNRSIPELVTETQNTWRNFECAKEKIPKLGMLKTYADI